MGPPRMPPSLLSLPASHPASSSSTATCMAFPQPPHLCSSSFSLLHGSSVPWERNVLSLPSISSFLVPLPWKLCLGEATGSSLPTCPVGALSALPRPRWQPSLFLPLKVITVSCATCCHPRHFPHSSDTRTSGNAAPLPPALLSWWGPQPSLR